MKSLEGDYREDIGLRLAAFTYYAVVLAGFVIGMYGLFSLFWLASAEIQHSARIVGFLL
jgi:hypothetical protein